MVSIYYYGQTEHVEVGLPASLKSGLKKLNAKLNRLSTVDFAFDMDEELAEVAA